MLHWHIHMVRGGRSWRPPIRPDNMQTRSRTKVKVRSEVTQGNLILVQREKVLPCTDPPGPQAENEISRNLRVTEWLRLEGPSGGHPAQSLLKPGTPRACCQGPHPGSFWIAPSTDSTTFLGNLCQYPVTYTEKFFLRSCHSLKCTHSLYCACLNCPNLPTGHYFRPPWTISSCPNNSTEHEVSSCSPSWTPPSQAQPEAHILAWPGLS